MLISHLSDLHLGYAQFGLEEREEDVYQCFNEAVDVSIREGVQLVVLAGDLFHTPRPSGKAVVTLGNSLKKLKERQIPAVFVLGEHDISRTRDIPFAYIFSNLGLARRLKLDEPFVVNNFAIFGENKARRNDIDGLISRLQECDKIAKQHAGKKILVLHQGLNDFNKFAGEMNAAELPPSFDYYALGHYHDHLERRFDYLGGPLAYPGSLDLTPSEGIKDTKKGFILADLSGSEVVTHWVTLEQSRPQFSEKLRYQEMAAELDRIIKRSVEAAAKNGKKPVVRLEITGKDIDSRAIAANLVKLNEYCIHYVWQPVEEGGPAARAYDSMPADIDAELYRLSAETLGSEELAKFAVGEILPTAAEKDARSTLDIVWEAYKSRRFKLK
ncbi:MAG TPA: DNA repair exonuclease [Nitrososphaera sp.]|jgi:DNA repair exonuclease SbcCD nuclease subunit|nr:DNA repair exonuclease [Nitrososphaera sp.]